MKRLLDPLFITYGLLWCGIHLCRYLHQPVPVLNDHLTDCIAVPAMAHLTLTFTRSYIAHDDEYSYPLGYLLFIAVYIAIVFEGILPHYSAAYTGDILDVAAYFGGALFYYYVHNKVYLKKYRQSAT